MADFFATGTFTWNSTNITGCWYNDIARTVQATTVPTSADNVYTDALTGTVSPSATVGAAVCNNFTNGGGTFNGGLVYIYGNISVTQSFGSYKTTNITTFYKYSGTGTLSVVDYLGGSLNVYTGAVVNMQSGVKAYSISTLGGGTINFGGYEHRAYLALGSVLGTQTCTSGATFYSNESGLSTGLFQVSSGSTMPDATVYHNGYGSSTINSAISNLYVIGSVPDASRTTHTLSANITGTLGSSNSAFNLSLTGNRTIGNISISNAQNARVYIVSSIFATQRTLTCNGTISIANCVFRDIVGAGSASWNFVQSTDVGDGSNNSGITFAKPKNLHWIGTAGGNWNDAANWAQRVLTFNGTSSYISITNNLTYLHTTTNSWSINVKVNYIQNNKYKNIIGNRFDSGFGIMFYYSSGYRLQICLSKTASTDELKLTYDMSAYTGTNLLDLHITYNGTKSSSGLILKINNTTISPISNVSTLSSNTINTTYLIRIGCDGAGTGVFDSFINDLKIWSSVVDPTTTTILPDILDMSLDEGGAYSNGTILYDRSASGNNGTMQGFSSNPWTNYVTGRIPLVDDECYDANSITSTGQTITYNGNRAMHGNIKNNGLANSPTLVTTYDQYFSGNVDVSGFGSLTHNSKTVYLSKALSADMTLKANDSINFYNIQWASISTAPYQLILGSNINILGTMNIPASPQNGMILNISSYTFKCNIFNVNFKSVSGNGTIEIGTSIFIHPSVFANNTNQNFTLKLKGATVTLNQSYGTAFDFTNLFGNLIIDCDTACVFNLISGSSRPTLNFKNIHFNQAGKPFTFYGDGGTFGSQRIVADSITSNGTSESPIAVTASNGQGKIDISSAKLSVSGVLYFGYCNMTNIICSNYNTLYAKGTQTGCTRVYNQVPYLLNETKPFGRLRSEIPNGVNGYDFNNIKSIETYT